MAVLQVLETTQNVGTLDDKATRDYTRSFDVYTSSMLDGVVTVRSALPAIYSSFVSGSDYDLLSFCTKIDCQRDPHHPMLWRCRLEYSSKLDWASAQQDPNPLNRPPDVSWDFTEYERPLTRDRNGYACINSAGDSYDGQPTYEDSRAVLTIVRNEIAYDHNVAFKYREACNAASFYGADPYCAKMKAPKGERNFENGLIYWKITYEIHFRDDGFYTRILDQGYRDINGKLFRDKIDNSPLSYPTLLDGRGLALSTHTALSSGTALNAASTTVIAGLSFNITDAPAFSRSDSFGPLDQLDFDNDIQIGNEVMQVVNYQYVSPGHTFTVVRGNGATDHPAGAAIKFRSVYAKYQPFRSVDYSPLNLEGIG